MKRILNICLILNAIALFIAFNLGMDYINFGYGLHPAIAFPICFAILGLVYAIMRMLSVDYTRWDAKDYHK